MKVDIWKLMDEVQKLQSARRPEMTNTTQNQTVPPTASQSKQAPSSKPAGSAKEPGPPAIPRHVPRAGLLRDVLVPDMMRRAISPNGTMDSETFEVHRTELLRDAGNPKDPLERMLIEQAGLAHVMVIELHGRCTSAESVPSAVLYATA